MKIIVIGLGQLGQELVKELIQKNHDVTVIDLNKQLIDKFTNKYEVNAIVGSGASKEVQTKAKCELADVVIALTDTDEINLMSCLTAKHLGAKYTIAKVKNLEYRNNDEFLKEQFNIDLVINSEHTTANEITRIVGYPSNIKIERFWESKINMAEIILREDSLLVGETIQDIKTKYKDKINIGCIIRKEKVIIPNNENLKLEIGDTIYVLANTVRMHKFLKKIKLIEKPVKSVLMVGCGNIGEKLISNLLKMNIKVKIIEFDLKKCQELSEKFEEANVVLGDEVNSDLLIEEGIKDYDCCISLTGNDESNLVISMFAWSCKTRKIITKIRSISYTSMLHNVEIDTTVSPYFIILSSIIKYIRSIKDCMNNSIQTLYRFANNQVDAIEFVIDKDYEYCNKPLAELSLKEDVLIGFIVRGKEVIIPNNDTVFMKGDSVIIVAKADMGISQVGDVF